MQINISTRHGHLSDAVRAKMTAKLEKLARLFETSGGNRADGRFGARGESGRRLAGFRRA